MRVKTITGEEIVRIFEEFIGYKIYWQILRRERSNLILKITGLIITPRIDNSVLGIALQKNINLIVTLDSIESNNNILEKNYLELIYINKIYILNLTYNWLFLTNTGKLVLNQILGGFESSIWNIQKNINCLKISFTKKIPLSSLFIRLHNTIDIVGTIQNNNPMQIKNIILNTGYSSNTDHFKDTDLIITDFISQKLKDYCTFKKVHLVYCDFFNILSEVAREIVFIFGKLYPQISFYYYNNLEEKNNKKMD